MRREWSEVAVAVQQRHATIDAPRRDQAIHRLPNSHPGSTQAAIVRGGKQGEASAADGHLVEREQRIARTDMLPIVVDAPEHFQQDEIADEDHGPRRNLRLRLQPIQQVAEQHRLGRQDAAEVIDPD